jgi:hypothetical protein
MNKLKLKVLRKIFEYKKIKNDDGVLLRSNKIEIGEINIMLG